MNDNKNKKDVEFCDDEKVLSGVAGNISDLFENKNINAIAIIQKGDRGGVIQTTRNRDKQFDLFFKALENDKEFRGTAIAAVIGFMEKYPKPDCKVIRFEKDDLEEKIASEIIPSKKTDEIH